MPPTSPKSDPLPAFCREVLQLYTDALAEVRFPDLDLGALEASAEQARAAQLAVERREAQLESARAELREQLEAMSGRAERALAYARIFAQTDPKLLERVEQVSGPQSSAPATEPRPKRRGRPRKVAEDSTLFASAPTSADDSDDDATESAA